MRPTRSGSAEAGRARLAGARGAGRSSDDAQRLYLQGNGQGQRDHGTNDGRQIPTSAGRGAGTVGRPHIDLISIGDVVKYRLEQMKHESEAMREYIVNT
jgi:hypothetical protein